MIFFPKRNKSPKSKPIPDFVPPPMVHIHHWQDFPPYIRYNISEDEYKIEIIEPYVCLDCKQRKDVVLTSVNRTGDNVYQEGHNELKQIKEENKDIIKSRVVVEDMINDTIHVDKEYNKYWHLIHSNQTIDLKPTLKL